jgi:hypothetical protein
MLHPLVLDSHSSIDIKGNHGESVSECHSDIS